MSLQIFRVLDLPLQSDISFICHYKIETTSFYATVVNSVKFSPLTFFSSKMPILPSSSSSTLLHGLSLSLPFSPFGPWRLHLLPPPSPLSLFPLLSLLAASPGHRRPRDPARPPDPGPSSPATGTPSSMGSSHAPVAYSKIGSRRRATNLTHVAAIISDTRGGVHGDGEEHEECAVDMAMSIDFLHCWDTVTDRLTVSSASDDVKTEDATGGSNTVPKLEEGVTGDELAGGDQTEVPPGACPPPAGAG